MYAVKSLHEQLNVRREFNVLLNNNYALTECSILFSH